MSEPKVTVAVTHTQLAAIANELFLLAERLKTVANTAKAQPSGELAMYNWVSVATGMKTISSFVAKAEESRLAAELGTPYVPGQLKPRSTAKKAGALPKSQRSKLARSADSVLEQNANYKTRKKKE